MMRSFRFRLALLATAVAGVALFGFSGVAWRLIYAAKVSRLDGRLEAQLARLTRRPLPLRSWQFGAADMLRQTGYDDAVALRILGPQDNLLYASDNWPMALDIPRRRSPQSPAPLPSGPKPDLDGSRSGDRPPPAALSGEDRLRTFRSRRSASFRMPRPVTRRAAADRWRIATVTVPSGTVAIAISLKTIDQEMAVIRTIFLVAIPGTLLLVAVGSWGLSSSALRPVQHLTAAMQRITVAGLDQRVSEDETDVEFIALIQVFNQMLARLERSFRQASRFSADAAHELKTPLAILQGELEQTLQQAEPGSELQQRLSSLLDEVRRLSTIVRKLLLLSLADAGQMVFHKTPLDLSALMAVMLEDVELLAPHLQVETDIVSPLIVQGDRDLLTQVLQNLVSNAIKYNLPEGWIRLEARKQGNSVQVSITNASRAIPQVEGDRIFDRFYRGDSARTRTVEGLGLGLSLSREIVLAHGGRLVMASSQGNHTTFTLTLPVDGTLTP